MGPERLHDKALQVLPGLGEVVVVPEGFHLHQLAARLEAQGVCSRADFLAQAHEPALLTELRIEGPSVEGYIHPATYVFERDAVPRRVLGKLLEKRRVWLDAHAAERAAFTERPLTELQWLTLASLVERETARADERPRVARVFLNRLADVEGPTRGRLQSDPTAAYGCWEKGEELESCRGFRGLVSAEMLRDAKNPYNTYRFAGLPPGPIASPSEASLLAVLHPAAGDELYFVADGTGRHTFSRTFEEHRQAVERLKVREN
ncbi:MAG TPA: endolytic transglycosylase MltG [Polyangiaceae bacterium]|nr:endolytic transglycosylase MltG [Polyangiaceae bacterium]